MPSLPSHLQFQPSPYLKMKIFTPTFSGHFEDPLSTPPLKKRGAHYAIETFYILGIF